MVLKYKELYGITSQETEVFMNTARGLMPQMFNTEYTNNYQLSHSKLPHVVTTYIYDTHFQHCRSTHK